MVESTWVTINNVMCGNIQHDIKKAALLVATDQGPYGIFVLSPIYCLFFIFRSMDFNVVKFARFMSVKRFLFREFPITGACNLMCWVPGMTFVYCMPGKIQFPIILCLQLVYSLMLSLSNIVSQKFSNKKPSEPEEAEKQSEVSEKQENKESSGKEE